jgi:acyl-coenzyme A synthetase/AMP-(fatty) acid ligase
MTGNPAVVSAVLEAAARHPADLAVRGIERQVTYAQLAAEIELFGAHLRASGVRGGDTVALHARRSERLPVALLAAWKLGCPVALVDSAHPAGRTAAYDRAVRPAWRIGCDHAVTPVERAPGGAGRASHILFTSGTTGGPAAVAVGADALVATVGWYVQMFEVTHRDRVALLSGLGHDPVLRDILVPLLVGGSLAVPPGRVFADPAGLADFVRSRGVTVLHATPALLEFLLAGLEGDAQLADVRLIVSSGAPLTVGTVRRLRSVMPATVVNAYGATETPQIVSMAIVADRLSADDDGRPDADTLTVGRGVAGAELLVDPRSGEVVVRSPHLALGYVDDSGPGTRFGADPQGRPGVRTFRTGDLGTVAADGQVTIVGRVDREVSVNGFRVAPEEIESAALHYPQVVAARAELVSGLVTPVLQLSLMVAAGASVDSASVRWFLRSHLPAHAVPTRVQILTADEFDPNHKSTTTMFARRQ